jgi:hypothetical protein
MVIVGLTPRTGWPMGGSMVPNGDVTLWCHNCGMEITWAPVRSWGRYYCCKLCLRGDICDCRPPTEEEEEPLEDRRPDVERGA